jgi:transposase
LPGVGPMTALVILAEIGDISRLGSARKRRRGRGDVEAHTEDGEGKLAVFAALAFVAACDTRAIGVHPHGSKPPDTPG